MNLDNITPAVKQLSIACVVLFIGTVIGEQTDRFNLFNILGLHYFTNDLFKPWQLITHMFMHGNLQHIIFNLFGLISLGTVLERFIGTKKFVQLYFFSGLGAILIHTFAQSFILHQYTGMWIISESDFPYIENSINDVSKLKEIGGYYFSNMVGASGCIYGVAVAYTFLFPNTEMLLMFIPVPIKAKFLIPGILFIDLFMGISRFGGDSIAHFAHIGGALFGFALIYYWRKFDKKNFY